MIEPRWGTPRNPTRESRLAEAEAAAAAFGIELFEWQRRVFDVALEVDDKTGFYRYRTVAQTIGRQNGKTLAAAVRIAMELMHPNRTVLYTAQDRNLAFYKLQEFVDLIMESDLKSGVKKYIRGAGREHLEMTNGSSFAIFTPSGQAGSGKTADLVLIDEALTHQYELLRAIEPTLATKPDGQMWMMSNAGDEQSTLLAWFRNLGHEMLEEGTHEAHPARLAWFEWSPAEDRFDPADPEVWRQAIPTIDEELGVHESAVAQACASQPPEVFAREWLNVWPSTSAVAVIDPEKWEACATPLPLPPAGLTFALDVAKDRDRATIAVAGQTQGRMCVEIVDSREGVGWVQARLVELTRRHRASVVIDGGTSAAGAFIATLENEDVDVTVAKLRDYVHACSLFFDAVEAGTLSHANEVALNDAAAVATRRNLGDAWAWQRRSLVDMTPLVAATLAHWAAVTVRAPVPAIH